MAHIPSYARNYHNQPHSNPHPHQLGDTFVSNFAAPVPLQQPVNPHPHSRQHQHHLQTLENMKRIVAVSSSNVAGGGSRASSSKTDMERHIRSFIPAAMATAALTVVNSMRSSSSLSSTGSSSSSHEYPSTTTTNSSNPDPDQQHSAVLLGVKRKLAGHQYEVGEEDMTFEKRLKLHHHRIPQPPQPAPPTSSSSSYSSFSSYAPPHVPTNHHAVLETSISSLKQQFLHQQALFSQQLTHRTQTNAQQLETRATKISSQILEKRIELRGLVDSKKQEFFKQREGLMGPEIDGRTDRASAMLHRQLALLQCDPEIAQLVLG